MCGKVQMDAVLRKDTYNASIMGNVMTVTITVRLNYLTSIDFSLFGTPYTLNVTACIWQS
jgi:hypothetical protein